MIHNRCGRTDADTRRVSATPGICLCVSLSCARLFMAPWIVAHPARTLQWGSLLQGIFPTQRWNPGLQHSRQMLSSLSHQGSPTCAYIKVKHFHSGKILHGQHILFNSWKYYELSWTSYSTTANL